MKIDYGNGKTEFGPGVEIKLSGDEVAIAIDAFLVANGVNIAGARTIYVNGELCDSGRIYVDPSGWVRTPDGEELCGRGPAKDQQKRQAALDKLTDEDKELLGIED